MAQAVVTLRIMPESPDTDIHGVQGAAEQLIDEFVGEKGEKRVSIEPVAFGLNALKITFVMDESQGSTEPLEQKIAVLHGVGSVQVIDVRRAIG
jgi:elongation factor 1-beta